MPPFAGRVLLGGVKVAEAVEAVEVGGGAVVEGMLEEMLEELLEEPAPP